MNQQEFDEQIAQANISLTNIGAAVQKESDQVAEFIANHPNLDASGLTSVVTNLGNVAGSIGNIFPDAPVPEP